LKQSRLIQVVTGLPPAIDGVGEYALQLARGLRSEFGIDTYFLVGNPVWGGPDEVGGFPVRQLSARTGDSLHQSLRSMVTREEPVLLHLSGYGYEKRGCPLWLNRGLANWKNRTSGKLITFFHELYAFGPPWRSSFWLMPLQRRLAQAVARKSDSLITTNACYAQRLAKWANRNVETVPVLPICSNVGEPESAPLLNNRRPRVVVFGGRGTRLRLYRNSKPRLIEACRALKAEEICDVGPPLDFQWHSAEIRWTSFGVQPAEKVSAALSSALAGFVDCPGSLLPKSTVFAAYCAHGLLPVNLSAAGDPADGLEAGEHYWPARNRGERLSRQIAQRIADQARKWYQEHRIEVHAKAIWQAIRAEHEVAMPC
jgi:hypothetical protein